MLEGKTFIGKVVDENLARGEIVDGDNSVKGLYRLVVERDRQEFMAFGRLERLRKGVKHEDVRINDYGSLEGCRKAKNIKLPKSVYRLLVESVYYLTGRLMGRGIDKSLLDAYEPNLLSTPLLVTSLITLPSEEFPSRTRHNLFVPSLQMDNNPPDRQVFQHSDLPRYLQAAFNYEQSEQALVGSLANAGFSTEYESTGRSFTFGDSQVVVSEGQARIVATSKEVLELEALHEQYIHDIKKGKQTRLSQLEDNCRQAILRITNDFDEQKKRLQEQAEVQRRQLQVRSDRDGEQEEDRKRRLEAETKAAHERELVTYDQRRSAAIQKFEAAKAKTEADFQRFTREMQATRDREIEDFRERESEAADDVQSSRAAYQKAASRMRAKVEAARASLNSE